VSIFVTLSVRHIPFQLASAFLTTSLSHTFTCNRAVCNGKYRLCDAKFRQFGQSAVRHNSMTWFVVWDAYYGHLSADAIYILSVCHSWQKGVNLIHQGGIKIIKPTNLVGKYVLTIWCKNVRLLLTVLFSVHAMRLKILGQVYRGYASCVFCKI